MNHQIVTLKPGLYFVATPIGSARDITLRALDILASADVIAAEDTRAMRRLLEIHGVPLGDRPLLSYHDHSGAPARDKLIRFLEAGKSVAYASEAGTPLIADPGYHLSKDASDAGFLVTSAPGPSAVVTALCLAGLPTDSFHFSGFLPNSKSGRRKGFEALKETQATLVFYESPRRLVEMLKDAVLVFGNDRQAAVCRELTKKFEEVQRGSLESLIEEFSDRTIKGEIVVLIDRGEPTAASAEDLETALKTAMETLSIRDAAEVVSKAHGVNKRKVYNLALKLKG